MAAYYNEIDKDCCAWLKELMREGLIPEGDVDDRSIKDVSSGDVRGYTHQHYFAGVGVWAYALRQAGWPDDREVWSGSPPCQPFSVAGRQKGADDPRHLWPDFFRLIDACRPARLFGEQVSGKAGYDWLDGVIADLESKDYACWAYDIPACAVDAPHIRNRLYWHAKYMADSHDIRKNEREGKIQSPDERPISGRMYNGTGRRDGAGELVHTPLIGRREGWPESEFRGGWSALAGANAPGDVAEDGLAKHVANESGRGWGSLVAERGSVKRASVEGHVKSELANAAEPQNSGRQLQRSGSSSSADNQRPSGQSGRPNGGTMGDADDQGFSIGQSERCDARAKRTSAQRANDASFWHDAEWIICHDGKARRTKPGLPLLAPGSPGRIPMWRALGNAICAPLAIEVIKAVMESEQCS